MRRLLLLFGIGLIGLSAAYGILAFRHSVVLAATPMPPTLSSSAVSLNWPPSGQAAIGAVGYGILAEHGDSKASPTASVAKLMVALAVLRTRPLTLDEQGPTLTLTQADVDSYNAYLAKDGSVARVTLGEQITEYQALEAMLLPSANNIADTLATWAFGSIAAYSGYANTTLTATLNMTSTHIGVVDASGYDPTTVSTAHDLILLGEAALQNPVITQIVAQSIATIPVAGTVQNVNSLLGINGINGIKTGNTDQAGGVYLFSAKQSFANGQSITIVGAIMDAPTLQDSLNESLPLLRSTEAGFVAKTLVAAGKSVGTYTTPWGDTVQVVTAQPISTILWQEQKLTPTLSSLKSLQAPVKKGTQVGTLTLTSTTTQSIPVITAADIPAPSLAWRLLHVF